MRTGKPSVVAAINGAIAGLAGITPASGFVSVEHSFVIGIAIGIASYSGVILFKEKLKIDDALDVSSVHGVAGIIGALSIGIFASSMINPAGPDGFLFGNPDQMYIQAIGVAVAGGLGFGGTWIIMQIIKHLVGIRVSPEVEDAGLDVSEHAESAYSDEEEFRLDYDNNEKDKDGH
jgi:Amt family ammonium transporter